MRGFRLELLQTDTRALTKDTKCNCFQVALDMITLQIRITVGVAIHSYKLTTTWTSTMAELFNNSRTFLRSRLCYNFTSANNVRSYQGIDTFGDMQIANIPIIQCAITGWPTFAWRTWLYFVFRRECVTQAFGFFVSIRQMDTQVTIT